MIRRVHIDPRLERVVMHRRKGPKAKMSEREGVAREAGGVFVVAVPT